MKSKLLAIGLILAVLSAQNVFAQKKSESSSKPSTPSTSSPPKSNPSPPRFSSPSTQPKTNPAPQQQAQPKQEPRKVDPTPRQEQRKVEPKQEQRKDPPKEQPKPRFSSPNTEKKSQPQEQPKVEPTSPKIVTPKTDPKIDPNPLPKSSKDTIKEKPKFSSPNTEQPQTNNSTSQKPATGNLSSQKPKESNNLNAKELAAKEERSRRTFVETKQAKAPPKTEYKTTEGKTVNVNPNSVAANKIRNTPSSYQQPQARQERTVEHIHHYHYSHQPGWYYNQPSVYVGCGYSPAFWWMMMEWDAERRARWLYNHQNMIERDAYERGIRDSAVAAEIGRLRAQNAQIDPNYVDQEFKSDPSLMYTQKHIDSVYPEVAHSDGSAGVVLLWLIGVSVLCVAAYCLMFIVRWGK